MILERATTTPAPLTRRPRRLRGSAAVRSLVRETALTRDDLIYPMFVAHGRDIHREIPSMPGNFHWSCDRLPAEIEAIAGLGLKAVRSEEHMSELQSHSFISYAV